MSSAPSTLEGAYLLHLLYDVDWTAWNSLKPKKRARLQAESAAMLRELGVVEATAEQLNEGMPRAGALYHVVGQKADLMLVMSRPTAEELGTMERALTRLPIWPYLHPAYSYLSVVELSLHGVAERYGKKLRERGLEEGSSEWDAALEEMLEGDKIAQKARLHPAFPNDRYLCFYPMDKKRGEIKNWFMLEGPERGKLMGSHGRTGRKYFGKVSQIISSSMGFDDFDWGVDLYAEDALQFKKLIYEMRFDEVSAIYAEFGSFFLGVRLDPEKMLELEPFAASV